MLAAEADRLHEVEIGFLALGQDFVQIGIGQFELLFDPDAEPDVCKIGRQPEIGKSRSRA